MAHFNNLQQHVSVLLIFCLNTFVKSINFLPCLHNFLFNCNLLSFHLYCYHFTLGQAVLVSLFIFQKEFFLLSHSSSKLFVFVINAFDLCHEFVEQVVVLACDLVYVVLQFAQVVVEAALNLSGLVLQGLGASVSHRQFDVKISHRGLILGQLCLDFQFHFWNTGLIFSLYVCTLLELVEYELMLICPSFGNSDACVDLILPVHHLLHSFHWLIEQLIYNLSDACFETEPIKTGFALIHAIKSILHLNIWSWFSACLSRLYFFLLRFFFLPALPFGPISCAFWILLIRI